MGRARPSNITTDRLVKAAQAVRRGDCTTALEQLKAVPAKRKLDRLTAAWKKRVEVATRRCIREIGLMGVSPKWAECVRWKRSPRRCLEWSDGWRPPGLSGGRSRSRRRT